MATVYSVLDSRDKNELNQTITNTKKELQGNIDTLETKHDNEVAELQEQVDALEKNKATKAELSSHNTSNSAHNDIRLLIQNLTTRLNTLADSDDDTLDQMSEIVAYIEANRDLIESITTSKVSVSDIINNLTTNVSNKPLSAAMGVELKRLIDAIPNDTLDIVNEKIIAHNIAGDAHEDIRTDVLNIQDYANTAQKTAENAKQLASNAQSDATDALQRVSSLEVGSGKIDRIVNTSNGFAVCEDVLQNSKPIKMVFYGKTVQNLWVNPSGTKNGVTCTANADGSVTLVGTSTSSTNVAVSHIYLLKPNTQYTVSCNAKVGATGGKSCFTIAQYTSDNSILDYIDFAYSDGTQPVTRTFTTASNMGFCRFWLFCGANTTVSGTYRIMLNEGPTAQPWCPPGLSSVDEVELVTAGKNLLSYRDGLKKATINGVTFTPNTDGTITIDGTATKQANFYVYGTSYYNMAIHNFPAVDLTLISEVAAIMDFMDEEGNHCAGGTSSNSDKTIISKDKIMKYRYACVYFNIVAGQKFDNAIARPRLIVGDVDENEIAKVSTTPINLQSHSLCSLPDGTLDELHIDADGNCTLVKRVGEALFDGDENWRFNVNRIGLNSVIQNAGNVSSNGNALCDTLPVRQVSETPAIMSYSKGWVDIRNDGVITDADAGKQFLQRNNTIYVYPLATPQTIDLGKIDLPRLPASTSHVWINGTADTTNFVLPVNDLSVRYWLPNGELVADIYDNGATAELSDNEIVSIWNGATGDIVEASNTDIEAIFDAPNAARFDDE